MNARAFSPIFNFRRAIFDQTQLTQRSRANPPCGATPPVQPRAAHWPRRLAQGAPSSQLRTRACALPGLSSEQTPMQRTAPSVQHLLKFEFGWLTTARRAVRNAPLRAARLHQCAASLAVPSATPPRPPTPIPGSPTRHQSASHRFPPPSPLIFAPYPPPLATSPGSARAPSTSPYIHHV